MDKIRTAVVGVGHLGSAHARKYRHMDCVELVGVVDTEREKADKIAAELSVPAYYDHRELLGKVDAVSIATPTTHHYEVAKDFLRAGTHLMIEKPMTKMLDEADRLLDLAHDHGCKIQVGHIERFNPAFMAIEERINGPKYIQSRRVSSFSFRSQDIGVVMDLMIHDIDVIISIVKSPIKEISAFGVNVISPVNEDIAHARIVFRNRCVADITASRVSVTAEREIKIFQKNYYLALDYARKKAMCYKKTDRFRRGEVNLDEVDPSQLSGPPEAIFGQFIDAEELKIVDYDSLEMELFSFVNCVKTGDDPLVTGLDGRRAIAAAIEIMDKVRSRDFDWFE